MDNNLNKTYEEILLEIYKISPYKEQNFVTLNEIDLNEQKINDIYQIIKFVHETYLKDKGIKLPNLKKGEKYVQEALCLVLLFAYPLKRISINDISNWVASVIGSDKHQGTIQVRHLSSQKGWNILNKNETWNNINNDADSHILIDFTKPKEGFSIQKRKVEITDEEFEIIKKNYHHCCATCGQKEGDFYKNNPNKKIKLEKGHRNPLLPLNIDNTIPHCEDCNQLYKNDFCFDKKGVPVSLGSEKLFMKSSSEIKSKCLLHLIRNNELEEILNNLNKDDLIRLTEKCMNYI